MYLPTLVLSCSALSLVACSQASAPAVVTAKDASPDNVAAATVDTAGQFDAAPTSAEATATGDAPPADTPPPADTQADGATSEMAEDVSTATADTGDGAVADAEAAETAPPADTLADAPEAAADTATPPADATPSDAPPSSGWPAPVGIVASGPFACPAAAPTSPGVFADFAGSAGVDLDRTETWPAAFPLAGKPVLEGGGAAIADFDSDGRLDLYFPVISGADRLYLADPVKPWVYKGFDVVTPGLYEMSATAADLDNDGDPDLVIGGEGVILLRNDGPDPQKGVVFTDVSADAGLGITTGLPLFASTVADLDRDGVLDIYLAALKFELAGGGIIGMKLHDPILLRGLGKLKYTNVSKVIVLAGKMMTYIPVFFDADNDSDQDLYLVNDFGQMYQPNQLLRNDTAGPGAPLKFTNVSALSGADIAGNGMGAAIGDYDRDGDLDVFFTGWEFDNHLLSNSTVAGEKPTFDDLTEPAGVINSGSNYASWGSVLADLNNDGWLDLFIGNGHLQPPGEKPVGGGFDGGGGGSIFDNPMVQYNNLYMSQGNGKFKDTVTTANVAGGEWTRAAAWGDLDRDGFAELVVSAVYGKPKVYRNGCDANNWLHVRLVGKASNRSGIGARVTAEIGPVSLIRDIEAGSTGLWSTSEAAALFGIGTAAQVDKLSIAWPAGKKQVFFNVPARYRLVVSEP